VVASLLGIACAAPASAAPPPELPDPTFQSVSQEVLITMDDGVQLAGTVALPSLDGQTALPGPFPVVVGMTPYSRNGVCGCYPPSFWATRGIAGAVVDVRGTGGSGGNLEGNFFSPREARDSAAVIEYLGTQPYSSGRVAMAGGSYVGITQFLAAAQRPRHLVAIAPQVPISDLYRDGFAHGGIPSLVFDGQYVAVQGAPGAAGANTDPFLLEQTLRAKLGQSPVGTTAFDYLERPNDDAFYRDRSPITNAERIEVPALIVGGWRDGLSPRGAPEMFDVLARRRGVETRLYMDPCTHKGCGPPFAPFTDPPGQEDISAVVFEFLSKHLTRVEAPDRPNVRYYVQARGEFVDADRWPPAGTKFERLGLFAGGLLAPRDDPPAEEGETAQYVTNPIDGFSLAFNKYGTVAASPYVPTDQRLEGASGLTFRTPVTDRPLDFAGPIALRLVAASTATDTDWYAKLSDVAPDGSESIIEEGSLRASHRALDPARTRPDRPFHTHTSPEPIEPNRFYEYDVEIWPTAYRIAPGHRLQLRLTSVDVPTHLPGSFFFDRDRPQDARVDLLSPAINTVRFDESYLTLPVSGTAAGRGTACSARTRPRRVGVRRGGTTVIRARLTNGGRRVRGATVRLRGPGFSRRARTNSRGRVRFRVRARRSGRARVSTSYCGGRLRVVARRAGTRRGPRFTG
jgi:putative CocE/NonD family hydrolase